MSRHRAMPELEAIPAQGRPTLPLIDLQAQRRRLGHRLDRAIQRILDHGNFIMGPEVGVLEQKLADFAGVGHAVTCASGTDALQLCLMAWDVGPGDAVFVPSFTFPATAEVVCLLGATPVFVDVRPDSFNMDPESLDQAIGQCPALGLKPSVVIVVDLFGQPADYPAIEAIARPKGLSILADAAQSFGARLDGQPVGALGDVTAVSFFPSKPLGCFGDGGAVLTDDTHLAEKIASIRLHGRGQAKYDNVRIGVNSRLDTLQAAVLLEKFTIFPDEIEARQQIASRYAEALADIATVPVVVDTTSPAWAHYTLRVADRDALKAGLQQAGVASAVYYPKGLHEQTAYRSCPRAPGGLPVSDALSREVLSLPMHPYLAPEDQDHVIRSVRHGLTRRC